jgi:hypothetical protein
MVNVEADVLAGPLLARKAAEAGVIYSMASGDQPALIAELVDWARTIGLEVVCAGKGTKYLPIYHPLFKNRNIFLANIRKPLLGIAPTTKGYADANFGGAIFDRLAYSGGVIMINDTAVITLCSKQSTTAYNTTEAELDAPATTLSKPTNLTNL